MSSEQPEKEGKTLLSKDELNRAINKLTQFLDVDEEEEQDDLPEYLRQKNNNEDYLDEPLIRDNLKDIAKEIAELAAQNEELTKRIMKHQKHKQKKVHSYDLTVKRLYDLNRFQQNKRAEMQFQLFQKEIKELTWSPQISETSRKLAQAKNNNVPLHLRVDQCLQNKEKNIEKIRNQMNASRKRRDPGFVEASPEKTNDQMGFKEEASIFSERKTKSAIKKEEVEKTWDKIQTWYAQRNDYITKGQFDKLEKEIQDLTLQPKINKSSKKMMEKDSLNAEPVEDRLIKRYIEKMEKRKKEQESAAKMQKNKPYISKMSQKLAQRHANKTNSPHKTAETEICSPHTEEKVKKKLIFPEKSSDKKTFNIEYKKQHEFLLDFFKK